MVLASGALVQQRNALKAVAICDRDLSGADERLQGVIREQRASALHHRKMGQPEQLSAGPHLLQQVGLAPLRELSAVEGQTGQGHRQLRGLCWGRLETKFY